VGQLSQLLQVPGPALQLIPGGHLVPVLGRLARQLGRFVGVVPRVGRPQELLQFVSPTALLGEVKDAP
jgi:hypothetical protein